MIWLLAHELADERERQESTLREDGIHFDILDCEEISRQLKTNPDIVDNFFGRAWVRAFCGPDSLADEERMDGGSVTTFRQQMRQFYEALVERLDPGIPIPPAAGRKAIPLHARFVLPDVQIEASVAESGPPQQARADGQAPTGRQPEEAEPRGDFARVERKYTHRMPVHTWIVGGRNSVITGGPGSGKSTLLRYITLEILAENPPDNKIAPWVGLLPVWIPFAFWTKQLSERRECGLSECIRRWLSLWGQDGLWPLVEGALNDSRLLLLVDGLDEWTSIGAGNAAASMLQVFLRTHRVAAIATTRPFAGVALHGPDWQAADVAPLTPEQQLDLCRKWFTLNSEAGNFEGPTERGVVNRQVSDFMGVVSRSGDLQELAAVPLLLVSLIFVHLRKASLPTDRFAAYDQLVSYLIQEHPARRTAAALSDKGSGFSPLREPEVRLIFSYVAQAIYPETVVTTQRLLQLVERFLNSSEGLGLGLEPIDARGLADQFARVAEGGCGLIMKQGFDDRSFLHRSLQEFRASEYLSHQPLPTQEQLVSDHFLEPQWREILLGLFWHTKRPDDVMTLLEPISTAQETPTREMNRAELLAEVAFGPFNCPTARLKEMASDTFRRIQRHEWTPHRARLLSCVLQSSQSAKNSQGYLKS
jgi:hypothetical protein